MKWQHKFKCFWEEREYLIQGKNSSFMFGKFGHLLIKDNKGGAIFAIINSKLNTEP